MKSRTKLVALHERNEEWISTTYTPLCKQVEKTFKKHCNKNITFITRNNLKRRLRTLKTILQKKINLEFIKSIATTVITII